MEFPDLLELVRVCRRNGVICALDNTWGAGLAFQAFDLAPGSGESLGVDVCVHALTKYPSGGGDVLMGSVVTRDQALHEQLKLTHMRVGWGVSANDAETVLRSLPSLALRYRAQDESARALAAWLASRDEVAEVLHPALPGAPGHEHWRAACGEAGLAAGIFSIVFDERFKPARVDAFCDALKLFKLGYSWGGPVSLVVPYDVPSMRSAGLGTWKHKGTLVRLCIGLEATSDLQADIEQALRALHR
jgi:cysteine-S-conjugate beta-lyase